MKNFQNIRDVKKQILKTAVLLLIGLLVVLLVIILYRQTNNIKYYNKKFNNTISNNTEYIFKHNIKRYSVLLERMLTTTNIIKYIAANNREQVYEILKPKFDTFKEETKYFNILHIINANGTSFLRVHNRYKHGDNLINIRPMIKHILKYRMPITGYETGKYSTVFRIMRPIFYKKKFLGVIEIGINPNYFLDQVKAITGQKGALFIKKRNLILHSKKINFDIGNFRLQTELKDNELNILKMLKKDYKFNGDFKLTIKNKNYIIHSLDLKTFDNKLYGKYIFIQDITDITTMRNQTYFLIIFAIIIFILILYYVLNKYFKELDSLLNRFYNGIIKKVKSDNIYLEAIQNNTSVLLVTSLNKKIQSANKQFFNFVGVKTIEKFSKQFDCVCDLFVERSGYIQKYMDGVYWIDYIKQNPKKIHQVLMKKDGQEYIFQVSIASLELDEKDKNVISFFDITELKKLEQELNRLKIAIEQSPISIVITDLDGNLEYVNPWFCKVTGYSYEEAIGENPKILKTGYTPDEEYIKLWDEITHDHIWRGTFKNKKKNGQEYWETAIIVPIEDKNKNITNYLGIKQEITKEVYLKEQLRDQEELMIAQSRQAAMGEMISMIAHQWRQPLSIISMGVNNILADIELEMLDESNLKDELLEITNQTKELSSTIDDFKNFFKPVKTTQVVNIEDILNETFKIVDKSLENNNITVIKNYNSKYAIETYSRELMQVFINILNNAKDILIQRQIKNRVIKVSVEDLDEQELVITICDNGKGISNDIMDKIFQPYFTTKGEHNGTGLGLYMSKTIVEKHLKGKLVVFNKDDGACFKIVLYRKKGNN